MKANKKAIETGNFWDIDWIHGAYAGTPVIDADETKARHAKIKERKRQEKRQLNIAKHSHGAVTLDAIIEASKIMQGTIVKPTKKAKQDMIQYGFDLANWWGEQHE